MIISIDWSFKKPLSLFNGIENTEINIERNETVNKIIKLYGKDIIVVTENIPHQLKRNLLEENIKVFTIHPNLVKNYKNENNIENQDDDNVSSRCIYQLYENSPEFFHEAHIDPKQESLRNIVKSFKDIQGVRIKIEQRNQIKSKFIDNDVIDISNIEKDEAKIKKQMEEHLKLFPVYNNFISKIKGVGPIIASQLLAHIDIKKAHNTSALIKYCGLGVTDGKADSKHAGKTLNYNPELKTICLGHLGESLIKQNDAKYRMIYDNTKKKYIERYGDAAITPAKAGDKKADNWNKMRVHLTARRVMVKQFLSDLWSQWRKSEGLEISYPYALSVLGHTTYITDNPIEYETVQIDLDKKFEMKIEKNIEILKPLRKIEKQIKFV